MSEGLQPPAAPMILPMEYIIAFLCITDVWTAQCQFPTPQPADSFPAGTGHT